MMTTKNNLASYAIGVAIAAALAGCTGTPTASETLARADVEAVRSMYRPGDAKPTLPHISKDSPLVEFLRFAMLNNPTVEAEYYAWAASVERVTGARSLPDPRITFEADITSMLETVMPGLMIDLPGPGKLRAAGDVAASDARASYFRFEIAVLKTAMSLKAAYFRMHFLEDTLRVQREALILYRLLANKGYSNCQVFLGWMLDQGLGTQVNTDEVFCWFNAAADQGSPEGMFYCGKLLTVASEHVNALAWYEKSAALDYSPALFRIAICYRKGLGVEADRQRADEYLEHASRIGHLFAKRELALVKFQNATSLPGRAKALLEFCRAVRQILMRTIKTPYSEELKT